jgi:RNA polymerase sigma-70 factor (ECF subfamily)
MAEKQSHFEELLLPHLDGAYNLARWLVERDEDAQAIVQKAYLRAIKEFRESNEADTRAWLLAIVRKTAHNWIQRGDHSRIVGLGETVPREEPAQLLPEAANQVKKRPLLAALSKLPVELREVLLLHDLERWSCARMASAIGTPRATVMERLTLARRTLRRELAEPHGGETK